MTGAESGDEPAELPSPADATVTPVASGATITDAQVEPAPDLSEHAEQLRSERAPTTTAYDPSPERERVRTRLSYAILGLTGLTGILVVLGALAGADGVDMVLAGVFTPLVGLSGAVMGFYFGGRETSSRSSP